MFRTLFITAVAVIVLMASLSRAAARIPVMLLDGESGGPYHDWAHVTPALKTILDEQRAVRRCLEVRPAYQGRVDEEAPFSAGVRSGNDAGPAVGIEAGVPVLIHEWRRGQESSISAIEHVEHPIAIGVHQQLTPLAMPLAIDEHQRLRRVPVMAVVGRELVVPCACAGVGIDGDDGIAEQVVAVAARAPIDLWAGIPDGPVDRVQLGIV
jgi:hypothetical protein